MTEQKRCDRCHELTGEYTRVPKTYDFSHKHAMARLGVPPKTGEVDFQKFTYYFEDAGEQEKFFSEHPDVWVTGWYYFCQSCENQRRASPDSMGRLLDWCGGRLGKEAVEKIISNELIVHLPGILKNQRDQLKKERRKDTRLNWKLGL